MSRYKVFHLRASNFYGGPERQLHLHALKARDSEFDVSVGSFTENGETPEFLNVISGDGILVHAIPVKNAYDTNAIRLLKIYLKENDIKILCTHDYRTHLLGMMASRSVGAKWIAFSRGWTAENLKIKLYHTLDKIIIRFADKIVAVSGEQQRKLRALVIPSRKIAVAYNAIDPSFFTGVEKADLRERFNFPDDTIIGVLGGRFSTEKGQIYLVEAANIALKTEPRLRFVMFGYGPDLEMIQGKAKQYGIEDKVICPGFEKNLLGHLMTADMLVNPSLSEGLPNIVLEAMAFKMPVVATAVGGVPELISDGESGLLVKAGDTQELADKILMMASDEKLREKCIAKGYETILGRFSFNSQADELYKVYKSVL